jgi:hypothetical protein
MACEEQEIHFIVGTGCGEFAKVLAGESAGLLIGYRQVT